MNELLLYIYCVYILLLNRSLWRNLWSDIPSKLHSKIKILIIECITIIFRWNNERRCTFTKIAWCVLLNQVLICINSRCVLSYYNHRYKKLSCILSYHHHRYKKHTCILSYHHHRYEKHTCVLSYYHHIYKKPTWDSSFLCLR